MWNLRKANCHKKDQVSYTSGFSAGDYLVPVTAIPAVYRRRMITPVAVSRHGIPCGSLAYRSAHPVKAKRNRRNRLSRPFRCAHTALGVPRADRMPSPHLFYQHRMHIGGEGCVVQPSPILQYSVGSREESRCMSRRIFLFIGVVTGKKSLRKSEP